MKLSEIVWPVYSLGKVTPCKEEGVTFVPKIKRGKDVAEIIDDINIPKKTLGLRRMELLKQGVTLFKIKYTIYFVGDLLKLAKPNHWFIDSSGKVFKYVKQFKAKLTCRKITNVVRHVGSCSIEVLGLSNRFSSLYPPEPDQLYAGILSFQGMKFLYGYYKESFTQTYRKV